MATHEQVKKWFDKDLDDAGRRKVVEAETAVKDIRGKLVHAKLIEPTATDGEVFDTLKMRH
jgi:hypothetical protein